MRHAYTSLVLLLCYLSVSLKDGRAERNSWHIGYNYDSDPAIIYPNGHVHFYTKFSYHVTCSFDFSDYPGDIQKCPIVIGSYFYHVDKVNITTIHFENHFQLKLNANAMKPKKHSAGWQVVQMKHNKRYIGYGGVVKDIPERQTDYYKSCIVYWLHIKRHSPYFFDIETIPLVATSCVTLVSLLLYANPMVIHVLLLNMIIQAVLCTMFLQKLPLGNGSVPKIASAFGLNLGLTGICLLVHIIMQCFIELDGKQKIQLPADVQTICKRLENLPTLSALFSRDNGSQDLETLTTPETEFGTDLSLKECIPVLNKTLLIVFIIMYIVTLIVCLF